MNERELWNARYAGSELLHGAEPAEFLRANARYLPQSGTAVDLAAGEGRNALWLAERGLTVIALDISPIALSKCKHRAVQTGLSVEPAAVDLSQFRLKPRAFDLIVNFNFLLRELSTQIKDSLTPGGVLVFESLTIDHLRWKPDFNSEYLLARGELLRLFRGLKTLKYRETDVGSQDRRRSVASLIAKRQN